MEVYIGSIILFAGNYAMSNFAFCQGQSVPTTQYQALYSILGPLYGGNGTTSFNLPNLAGRVPMGSGQVSGASPYTVGQKGGSSTVTLTSAQMPAHTHAVTTSATAITASLAATTSNSNLSSPQTGAYLATPTSSDGNPVGIYAAGQPSVSLGGISATLNAGSVTVGPTGGSSPVNIMQPYLALGFLIALNGLYPTRD